MAATPKKLYAVIETANAGLKLIEFAVMRKGVDGKLLVQADTDTKVRMLVEPNLTPAIPIYGKKLFRTHREAAVVAKELATKRYVAAEETLKYWKEKAKLSQRDVLAWMGAKPDGKANAGRKKDVEPVHDERSVMLERAADHLKGTLPGLLLASDEGNPAGNQPAVAGVPSGGVPADAPSLD